MVKKLLKKLILRYRNKLLIVSILVGFIISLFFVLNNMQVFINDNINTLTTKYKGFDFKFSIDNSDKKDLSSFAKKYHFDYDNQTYKTKISQIENKSSSLEIVTPSASSFDSSSANLASYQVTYMPNVDRKFVKTYLLEGTSIKNDNEIQVSKDFLNKTGYQLGKEVAIDGLKYKIVGIFGDQNNQSTLEPKNLIQNKGSVSVITSQNVYNNLDTSKVNEVYARFNSNLDLNSRNKIYTQMQNDSSFNKIEKVDKIVKTSQSIKYDINNVCFPKQFNDYLQNSNLSESNFKYLKNMADNSLKSKNICKVNFEGESQKYFNDFNYSKVVNQQSKLELSYQKPSKDIYNLTPKQIEFLEKYDTSVKDKDARIPDAPKSIIIDGIQKFLLKDQGLQNYEKFYKFIAYNGFLVSSNTKELMTRDLDLAYKGSIGNSFAIQKYNEFVRDLQNEFLNKEKYKVTPISKVVNYNKVIGKEKVKQLRFHSFVDKEQSETSKQLYKQVQNQQILIYYLFVIFGILLVMVSSIVISQILKGLNIEIGTLKAIGTSSKFIIKKFMMFVNRLLMYTTLFVILFTILLQYVFVGIYNNSYALPSSNIFAFDYITNAILVIIIYAFIYVFGNISLKRAINDNTLLLLKNLNSSKSKFKEITLKKHKVIESFWNQVICKNLSKGMTIFFIGMIFSIFAGTLILLFSNVSSYLAGGNGFQITAEKLYTINEMNDDLSNNARLNLRTFDFTSIKDENSKIKALSSGKEIGVGDSLSINILGVDKSNLKQGGITSNGINLLDTNSFKQNELNSGIILSNKYHNLFGINIGDQLTTQLNGKSVDVRVSGFVPENENIFAYTSKSYLQSINSNIRSSNVYININEDKLGYIDALNVSALKATTIEKNQSIVAIIMEVLVVLSVILLPIVMIIVSDVVDTNMKTIATMRAIGIGKFKIRLNIIQPYSLAYIAGVLFGLVVILFGFAEQFSHIFFSFMKVDIIYSIDWFMLFGITFVVWIVYEIIISVAFARISIISLAKTLNDDTNRSRITKDDLKKYYKKLLKSTLDYQRKPFHYKPTKVTKLNKSVSRSFWNEVIRYLWPIYLNFVVEKFNNIVQMIIMMLLAFIPSGQANYSNEVGTVVGFITSGWILGSWKDKIITVAINYATQYYRQNKKVMFKRTIAFAIQISLATQLLIAFLLILFGQLGMQAMNVDSKVLQFFATGLIASLVSQIISNFALPYTAAINASGDTKVNLWQKVFEVFNGVIMLLLSSMIIFLKDVDITMFSVAVAIISSIPNLVPLFYGHMVKKHKDWAGGSWKYLFSFKHPISARIFNKTIPFMVAIVFENISNWILFGLLAVIGIQSVSNVWDAANSLQNLNMITPLNLPGIIGAFFSGNQDLFVDFRNNLLVPTSALATMIVIFQFARWDVLFTYMSYFMNRILASKSYLFATQIFNNVSKVILIFYIAQTTILLTVSFALLQLFSGNAASSVNVTDFNTVAQFVIIGNIYALINTYKTYLNDVLISGGEFKYTQYVSIIINNLSWVVLLISLMTHLNLITIFAGVAFTNLIQIVLFYRRIKTGRWLYSLSDDTTIHSNIRGWKDKKLILQNVKDKKYRQQLSR